MFLNVNIVTENNYFFIGAQEHLRSERVSIRKINPSELKNISASYFKKNDVVIFHASHYIDEFLFLISLPLFLGKVIFIPLNNRMKFDLGFKQYVFLDARADINIIFNEITKITMSGTAKKTSTRKNLTKREEVVIFHTISGMDVQAISHSLSISKKTVYAHRRNALHKLGGRNFFEIWPMKEKILRSAVFDHNDSIGSLICNAMP